MGLENPASIAFRYAYDQADYDWLSAQDWFVREVEKRKSELRTSGWTYRAKMGLLAEEAGIEIFKRFKTTESLALQIDIWKYLNKLADLEPKAAALPQNSGTGFSITINLANNKANTGVTIDQGLPPPPEYVTAIPFDSLTMAPID